MHALNETYKTNDFIFETQETYTIGYLSKIKDFINKDIVDNKIKLVSGSGKKKTSQQRLFDLVNEYIIKLSEYQQHYEIMGKDRKSYSRTDHDATFMRLKEDHMQNQQLKPAYNLQIGVSNEYILSLMISQDRSDFKTYKKFLELFKQQYGYYPKRPVADSGYGSLENYRYTKLNGMELFQKYGMYEKRY